MAYCLFCNTDVRSAKPEHILQNALGGKKTSRRLICSPHNGSFGASIDNAVAEQVRFIRNFAQFPSGTGQPPPMLKNMQAGNDRYAIRNDGSLELNSKPLVVTQHADGSKYLQINATSMEQLRELLPHIAALLKVSEAEALELIKANGISITSRPPDNPAGQDLQFGGDEVVRSFTKSCLELWATQVGNDEVRSAAYAGARAFVLGDQPEFIRHSTNIDTRGMPRAADFAARYSEFFNLIYVKSNKDGRVIGHFTLYNMMAWRVVLAERGGTPNLRVALVSNPTNPTDWSDRIAQEIDIDFGWLDAFEPPEDYNRMKERLGGMYQRHLERSRDHEIGYITDSTFERHGLTELSPETDDAIYCQVIGEMEEQTARHFARVPHQRQLTPAEIHRLLRGRPRP